jgi:hypothetical protein
MSNFSTLLYKTNSEGDTENISHEKLRTRHRKHFLRVFLLGDLDRRNILKRFSSWRSWRKEHSQEFFFLKILTETFARVLFLKILTETFPRVFFLKNLLRISASTQCTASENEEKEVRLLLSHAFHWWIHTPIPSVWPNQTTTDFFLLLEAYRKSGVWSFIVVILLYRSRTNKEKKQQLKLVCGVLHQFKQSSLGGYGGTLLSVWYGTLSWGWWCSGMKRL